MIKRVHTSKDGNVQIGRQEPSGGEIASCKDIEAWKETSVPASTSFRLLEHTRKQDNHHNHKQRRPRHIRLHEIPTRQSCINSLASNTYTMTQLVYVNVLRLSNPCTFNPAKNLKYVTSITIHPISPATVVIFTNH